jgi:prepilin peptidase CpaA
MLTLCLAVLAALLVIGAAIDIDSRRLPNWLTAAVVALFGVYAAFSPNSAAWLSALLIGGLVFAIGFACFAFQLMGGGDVKLMAGLALWAGVDHIGLFLLVTSLAGGLLSMLALTRRLLAASPLAPLAWPVERLVVKRRSWTAASGDAAGSDKELAASDESLPYGVAIAAGGLAVIYALLQL